MNDFDKKILETENELNFLKKKKHDLIRQIKYKSSQQYRRDRARRLIETGALAEKYFEIEDLSLTEKEELFKSFSNFVISNKSKKFKKNK